MSQKKAPRGARSLLSALALAIAVLGVVALPADARIAHDDLATVAANKKTAKKKTAKKTLRCSGHRVRIVVARRSACVPVGRPAGDATAEQRAFDRALLSSRLTPRRGRGPGRTVASWLGSARAGLTVLERSLGAPTGARAAHVTARGASRASAAAGWRTTVSDRLADGETGLARVVIARRGKAKLTLDTKDTVKLETCPDEQGTVPGTRTRSTSLKLEVPLRGGYRLTVRSTQSTRAPFTGTTDEGGLLARVAVGRMKTSAKARGELRDAAGNVVAVLRGGSASAIATAPAVGADAAWPAVLTDPATAFTASSALRELVRGGSSSSLDPLLRRFVVGMQTDLWRTYDLARRALVDEQTAWWQAGRCIDVTLSAARSQLADGEATTITATVTPPKGKALATGRLSAAVSGAGGTIDPDVRAVGAAAVPLTFTAPAQGWSSAAATARSTVHVRVTSRQGVAVRDVDLTPVPVADRHFRVTALGGSYDMEYSFTRALPPCTVTGSERYAMSVSPTADREATDGHVRDGVASLILLPTRLVGAQDYGSTCDDSQGHVDDPCHGPIDVTRQLDFLGILHERGAPTATVTFSAPGTVAFVWPMCPQWFHDGGEVAQRDHPFMETTVPWSVVTGTKPFTVAVQDAWNDPIHAVTRSRSVTLQPVDAGGQPLG